MQDLMHRVYKTTREQPDGTFLAAQFCRHMELFPEGQFVALEAGQVVGLTASMRIAFDPEKPFIEGWYETISDGWLTRHDPDAEWMYGVESCVDPDYQGSGIGGTLMEARFDVAKALNLRGMVAGSAVISYHKLADSVAPDAYVRGVVEGRYFDNNLSKQLRKGFRAVALIPNYLPDPDTRGWGVVIVWDNPDFDPARPIGGVTVKARRYRVMPRRRA
jgi:GNAT superfamily N-acetyltransferase